MKNEVFNLHIGVCVLAAPAEILWDLHEIPTADPPPLPSCQDLPFVHPLLGTWTGVRCYRVYQRDQTTFSGEW